MSLSLINLCGPFYYWQLSYKPKVSPRSLYYYEVRKDKQSLFTSSLAVNHKSSAALGGFQLGLWKFIIKNNQAAVVNQSKHELEELTTGYSKIAVLGRVCYLVSNIIALLRIRKSFQIVDVKVNDSERFSVGPALNLWRCHIIFEGVPFEL